MNPIDPVGFSISMTGVVRRAGEIAEALRGRAQNHPKLSESSAVKQALTEAVLRVQEEILQALLQDFPDCSLAAEEDTPSVSLFSSEAPATVIIDPIDGTLRSYLEGAGPYAVIVGLVLAGRVHAALVAVPQEGIVFRGAVGNGVQGILGAGEARDIRVRADGRRILVSHTLEGKLLRALEAEGFEVEPACGGAIAVAPLIPGVCAGLRLVASSAEGGVSIRGRVGVLLAREAGAHIRGDAGREFPLDLESPNWSLRITANEEDQARIERALEASAES